MKKRQRSPKPYIHLPSLKWRFSCGVQRAKDGSEQLKPKLFTFPDKATAFAAAENIKKEWWAICKGWNRLKHSAPIWCRETPHWVPIAPLVESGPTPEMVTAYQNRTAEEAEEEEQVINPTLHTLKDLYLDYLKSKGKGESNLETIEKNLRNAISRFPGYSVSDINEAVVLQVIRREEKLIKNRSLRNYMGAMRASLEWFYKKYKVTPPDEFEDMFSIEKKESEIIIPTLEELKIIKTFEPNMKLWCYLALNAGMIPVDVADIRISEYNQKEGYVYWKRRKEPQNPPFRHNLFPEVKTLLDSLCQKGKPDDYLLRYKGKPLIPNPDKEYNVLQAHYQDLNMPFPFMNIRKSTSNIMSNMLYDLKLRPDEVDVTTDQFLSHTKLSLLPMYRQKKENAFGYMNQRLAEVGSIYRRENIL